jgi:HEAT repeats
MTYRLRLKCVCGILVVVALFAFALVEPTYIIRGVFKREAFFHSRPTSYWREILRKDGESGQVSEATKQQFDKGRFACRVLNECLGDADANVRKIAIKLIETNCVFSEIVPALDRCLDDPDVDIRCDAAWGLGRCGSEAFCVTPKLVKLLQNPDASLVACADHSLWAISPEVAAKEGPWRVFDSDKLQFSVLMPGSPHEERKIIQTPFGEANMSQFTLTFGHTHFAVAVVEYPQRTIEEFTEAQRYDSTAEMTAKLLDGQLQQYNVIEHKGRSGRETAIEVADKAYMRTRSFLIGCRAYLIQVTYVPQEPTNVNEQDYFFDSLNIIYSPEPKEDRASQ